MTHVLLGIAMTVVFIAASYGLGQLIIPKDRIFSEDAGDEAIRCLIGCLLIGFITCIVVLFTALAEKLF